MTLRNYERADRKNRPCLICGKFGKGCLNQTDGRGALCSQVESSRPSRGGCIQTWYHSLDGAHFTPKPTPKKLAVKEVERADIELRDPAYCKLIRDLLTLDDAHARALLARGLTRDELKRAGYVSTPSAEKADLVARQLSEWIDLKGVPGFHHDAGRWRMVRMPRGILIPYRNERGQIEGLQVRPDVTRDAKYFWLSSKERERGSSPGSPVHFSHRHLVGQARELVITEGALKAHVCAHLTQQTVIAVPGVGNFGPDFAERLKAFAPRVRRAVVAYDRDLSEKREVYAALQKLTKQLQSAGFDVSVRTWPAPSKGYDDYLLSQLRASEVQAA